MYNAPLSLSASVDILSAILTLQLFMQLTKLHLIVKRRKDAFRHRATL